MTPTVATAAPGPLIDDDGAADVTGPEYQTAMSTRRDRHGPDPTAPAGPAARFHLGVDLADGAASVAVGPDGVEDPALIVVDHDAGLVIDDAVRRFLRDERLDPGPVTSAVIVTDHDTPGPTQRRWQDRLGAVLDHGPVFLLDRRDAQARVALAGVPHAGAAVGAVLVAADHHRGRDPVSDLAGAEALFGIDPEAFERWAVRRLGGHPLDDPGDRGVDGMTYTTPGDTGRPRRLLTAVKGGHRIQSRTVLDLVHAVETHEADGAALVGLAAPGPEVYATARQAGASPRWPDATTPLVQILTIAEVLDGRRPLGSRS